MQMRSNKLFIIDFALIFTVLGSLISFHYALASEKRPEEVVFSIHATNEPIEKVLENISWASGYEIILKTGIKDLFVSIQLNNVTLQEAINRILRKYNHIEVLDEREKRLELYILESKDIPVSISGKKRSFEPATKTTRD
jgi:hypothetical protein